MPSTYAHYRMGQEVIKQVSAPARDIIMKHYVERKPRAIGTASGVWVSL